VIRRSLAVGLSALLASSLTLGISEADTSDIAGRDNTDRGAGLSEPSEQGTARLAVRNGVQVRTVTDAQSNIVEKVWARPEARILPDGSVVDGGAGGIGIDAACRLPGLARAVQRTSSTTWFRSMCATSQRASDDTRKPRFRIKACRYVTWTPDREGFSGCWFRRVPKKFNRGKRRIVATDKATMSSEGHKNRPLKRLRTGWHYLPPQSPVDGTPYKKIFDRYPNTTLHSSRDCITISGSVMFTPAGIGGSASISAPLCRREKVFDSDKNHPMYNHWANWMGRERSRTETRTVKALSSVMQKRYRHEKPWLARWSTNRR
jgi:hypothetical protein